VSKAIKLLVLEDSEDDAKLAIRMLRRGGFDVQHERVQSAAALQAALAGQQWDAVISDFGMPGFTGMDALRILQSTGLDIPFILISGTVGEETAAGAMKAGANDYIMKENLARLAPALERELKEAAMRAGNRRAQRRLIEGEAGLRRAQLMAGLAHVITGPDGAFESWSETLPQLIAVTPAQMPTSTREFLELVHPEDRASLRATSIEAGKRGTRMDVEYRVRRSDDQWLHIRQTFEPLEESADETGRMRWFNTLQDVSGQKQAAFALRRSEELYRATFEQVAVGMVRSSLDGEFQIVNQKLCELTGYPRGEAILLSMRDIIHAQDIESSIAGRSRMLTGPGTPYQEELRLMRKGGSQTWVNVTTSLVRASGGQPSYFVSVFEDISERKQADKRIRRLNRVYAVLSGINALIVRVRDRQELFREACRIAVEAGQFRLAWLGVVDLTAMRIKPVAWHGAGQGYIELMPLRLDDAGSAGRGLAGRAFAERKAMISDDMTLDPRVLLKKEALERGLHSLAVLPLLAGEEVVGVLALYAGEVGFFDADEMKLLHELAGDIAFAMDHIEKANKVNYLAYYDSLTGLANRTLLHERLAQFVSAASDGQHKLALVLLDIERFKTINDSLGRHAGDALLKQMADRLQATVGEQSQVARVGADHFAFVIPNVGLEQDLPRIIEDDRRRILEEPFQVNGTELRISTKAGVALFPRDGADADTLFRNAEAALKKAKASGEPHLFYTQQMTERSGERLTLENQLRQALEKEEFVLHYQSKVDSTTGAILGVEALIRWNSAELGLVPPMKFIPLMEETGLILEVGAWALQKAVQDHSQWLKQGLVAPRIAVNVSPIQLRKRDFVTTVERALKQGAVPPGIDLEITESLIMEDIQGNIGKLKKIRDLGVGIAIDDFGTGYSSLAYLAKLPVQTLKIDRSFIITMLDDPDTMSLVSTVISLAHSLRLKVVAEGVDAEDQAKFLRLLRCDEMQGYLFSKPLPLEEMTALLRSAALAQTE
jgi:diguanylate cyclase (GGDEF)-like protein/PAS domain S-box-containing protein